MDASRKAQPLTPGAQRILDAAAVLFYSEGIMAVGVDRIAAESGVTKRTLYDRFGSKEALVVAYLTQRDAQWRQRLEARLETAPRPRALALFDSYWDDAEPTGRGCAFLNAAAELPVSHPARTVIERHKSQVRTLLEDLIREDLAAEAEAEAETEAEAEAEAAAEDSEGAVVPARASAEELAEHTFLLLEGAVAHSGIDRTPTRLRQARVFARQALGLSG